MTADAPELTTLNDLANSRNGTRSLARLLPGLRAEEFVGVGRLVLALCLLLATSHDESLPADSAAIAETLLGAYAVFAIGALAVLYAARVRALRYRWLAHSLDIGVLMAVLVLTGGATAGYFAPLFFPIASAALRWRQRGVLLTGGIVLVTYAATAAHAYFAGLMLPPAWLVRTAALAATVLLIAQLRAVESHYLGRILELARWPRFDANRLETLVQDLLERSASVFSAPQAVLVLDDFDEPWQHIFESRAGEFSHTRRSVDPATADIVAPPLDGWPFLLPSGPRGSALFLADRGHGAHRGETIAPWLAQLLDDAPVLGIPLRSDDVHGWLLLTGVINPSSDDLRLAGLMGRQTADALEQFALSRELRLMSASEERVRVSRDLHDGVLQTLSGIALRLTSVRQSGASAEETREQLKDLEQLMLDEQRSLRFFTEELRAPQQASDRFLPGDALVGLVHRLERIWSIRILWNAIESERIPPQLAADVYKLVHETVVNAARHGHASTVQLQLRENGGRFLIVADDDGYGFPFEGRMTLAEMKAMKRGPRTLRERVEGLGGDLIISSSPTGASLEIILPVGDH